MPGRNVPFPPMEAEPSRSCRPASGSTSRSGTGSAESSRTTAASSPLVTERAPAAPLLPRARAARQAPSAPLRARRGDRDLEEGQARLRLDAAPAPPSGEPDPELSAEIPAQFIVFDILLWKGEKLHELPLEKRRKELERKAKRFQLSPYTRDPEEAERWLDRIEAAGLDGVVAKRLDSPYLPGVARGRREGQEVQDGRLRDRRIPLQREGGGADLDAAPRAVRQGR